VTRAILDTSIFIAEEQGRPIARPLPDEVSISVVSIAELELGVLTARDPDARAQRLRTLTEVRALGAAIAIDERTGSAYARLAAAVLAVGRRPRPAFTTLGLPPPRSSTMPRSGPRTRTSRSSPLR